MSRARYATKAAIARARAAAEACGIVPGGIRLAPDGSVTILPVPTKPRDDFAEWEASLQ